MNNFQKTVNLKNVEIFVQNLEIVKIFYRDLIGLEILEEQGKKVTLGSNNVPLVTLVYMPKLKFPPENSVGLYHTAFLYSERNTLTNILKGLLNNAADLYQGAADHLVSEAFYFQDPEGNGVELYFDKQQQEWTLNEDNKPIMGSDYIDVNDYISAYSDNSKDVNLKIGHIHLKVSNLDSSKEFYINKLKFDLIWELPSALFVSKDNYHHHIGLNTWQSLGSPKKVNMLGLNSFEVHCNGKTYFEEVKKILKIINDKKEFNIFDPNGIKIKYVLDV